MIAIYKVTIGVAGNDDIGFGTLGLINNIRIYKIIVSINTAVATDWYIMLRGFITTDTSLRWLSDTATTVKTYQIDNFELEVDRIEKYSIFIQANNSAQITFIIFYENLQPIVSEPSKREIEFKGGIVHS